MDIRLWLEGCGLEAHAAAFEREELTVADLPDLTDGELRELGLSLGARKALRRALGAGSSAVQGTPAPPASEVGESFFAEPTVAGPVAVGGAIPAAIDGYPVEGVLGQGGMGSVYRVRDRHTDRPLALKTLRLDLIDSDGLRQRFTREYGLLQHLNHPQVVRVFSMGEDQQSGLYYTMELLEGGSLESRVRVHAPDGEQALSWWRQIAAGVAAAHDAGVWHRDLKPANVVFRDPEAPVVVDWGLGGGVTANSRTGALGTAVWAAPEQAAGVTGAFTDVYGLSALLLWLLTEELPTNEEAAIGRYLRDVGGDERLAPVLARGLAGRRRRFEEIAELLEAFDGCFGNRVGENPIRQQPAADVLARQEGQAQQAHDGVTEVAVPFVYESMIEGVLGRWLTDDGALVEMDQPIFELETDEVAIEVGSPASGFLSHQVSEGATVQVGYVVGKISTSRLAVKSTVKERAGERNRQEREPEKQARQEAQAQGDPRKRAHQKPEPEARACNNPVKPSWCSDYGVDEYGYWAAFEVSGTRVHRMLWWNKTESFVAATQRFRWCPPGRFVMGSPVDETGRDDDETPHEVVLTRGFWLAETACTQALWEAVTGDNPSYPRSDSQHPVTEVSWDDCQGFLGSLNDRIAGLSARLPTEAEWEYACRAGTASAFNDGSPCTSPRGLDRALARLGWFGERGGKWTHPVAGLRPNAWGLYDMHGNVWEWCQDWHDPYPGESVSDPKGPVSGTSRVSRGGCWLSVARDCRAANRDRYSAHHLSSYLGFRLCAPGQTE